MNAPALDLTPSLPCEPFNQACQQVNEWRGRCQNVLARAEAAVTRTLLAMAAVPGRGKDVTLQLLVGQRYDALAAALKAGGPFAAEAGRSVAVLAQMREHDRLRVALCHGVGEVSLDRNGRWTLLLDTLAIRAGDGCTDLFVIREREAEPVYEDLARTAYRLASLLGNITAALRPVAPVID